MSDGNLIQKRKKPPDLYLGTSQRAICRKSSTPGKIRTCDLRFRKPAFYPAELRVLEGAALSRAILSFPRLNAACLARLISGLVLDL